MALCPQTSGAFLFSGERVWLSPRLVSLSGSSGPFLSLPHARVVKLLGLGCLQGVRRKESICGLFSLPKRDAAQHSLHALTFTRRAPSGVRLKDPELSDLVAVYCELQFAFHCPSAAPAKGSSLEQGHGRSHR